MNRVTLLSFVFAITTTWSCNPTSILSDPHPVDPHSFGNMQEAKTKHLDLNLNVDFEKKVLSGVAKWTIENRGANQIIFDIRDLDIEKVTIGKEAKSTNFSFSKEEKYLGQALIIDVEPTTTEVSIHYKTSPESVALLWVEPEQTSEKNYPFLFTQGQAVLTRAWIPCQDSPGVRVTYNATVQVPPGLLAVMSATNPRVKSPTGKYFFEMNKPIPPYLIAMGVGDLIYESIGKNSGVYAEASILDDATYEFSDVDDMMDAAESLYGPYAWDTYDILVLPPSFPFGGMENPRLTFVTPTIIAGDKSLTTLIAHELAHSWSGNLVTNATWNDFWLNEGFTVYFERRIMELVESQPYTAMLTEIGYQDLLGDIEDLGAKSKDTHLRLDLEGRDPDDGMTDIAYEKGAFFLTLIEQQVGRPAFDDFLRKYFAAYRFKSITTDEFLKYLDDNLLKKYNTKIDIKEWVDGPGIPKNIPFKKSVRFSIVDAVVKQIVSGKDVQGLGITGWSSHEILHLIRQLPKNLPSRTMKRLDYIYHFSDSGNAEIQAAWIELSIYNSHAIDIMDRIEAFLIKVGRRKFLEPIYKAFVERGQLEKAKEIYAKARPGYHAITKQTLDELLNWK